jgi:hypothetical protein
VIGLLLHQETFIQRQLYVNAKFVTARRIAVVLLVTERNSGSMEGIERTADMFVFI